MAQSLSKIYLHMVFSTKGRVPFITSEIEDRLHKYMASICQNQGCFVHEIGGMEDHVHILVEQSRTVAASKALEVIKANSSKWIKTQLSTCSDFSWQGGYGVFSVDQSSFDGVRDYIANQKEHHKKLDFKSEFLLLLKRANVTYDERYLWD